MKLKFDNPRLAALLRSDVTVEARVVVRRARGVLAADERDARFLPDDGGPVGAPFEHPA